jgi:hypothetical protein
MQENNMKRTFTLTIISIIFTMACHMPAYSAVKTIYIKPFSVLEGFKRTDPVGNLVKDYVSEYIIENMKNKYAIISDDEVKQVMANEELRMTMDACYDDACMKQLMKSIKTDYMIYGTVSFTAAKHIITIKMLDRSGGDVRVGKVKTLEFKNRLKLKMAAKDLAAYVVSGKEIDMDNYIETDEKEALKTMVKNAPYGLAVSYRFFSPMSAPMKKYFTYFHGGALEYTGACGRYVSLFGGGEFLYGTGITGQQFMPTIFGIGFKAGSKTASFMNSYYIGARFGYPVSAFFYPYIGISAKGSWYQYTYKGTARNYVGAGIDGSAGVAFTIQEAATLFMEFRGGWGMLIDKKKTDMSGIGCGGGVMVRL